MVPGINVTGAAIFLVTYQLVTLTYEDVTNVDSVGIIMRSGLGDWSYNCDNILRKYHTGDGTSLTLTLKTYIRSYSSLDK